MLVADSASFNPRLRTGGDMPSVPPQAALYGFQSTPPHGRRRGQILRQFEVLRFQSTPPHGRRPSPRINCLTSSSGFNPRLRTGGDGHRPAGRRQRAGVSIHASAREATHRRPGFRVDAARFQSTPPHGRRPLGIVKGIAQQLVSIHASAREATSLGIAT